MICSTDDSSLHTSMVFLSGSRLVKITSSHNIDLLIGQDKDGTEISSMLTARLHARVWQKLP